MIVDLSYKEASAIRALISGYFDDTYGDEVEDKSLSRLLTSVQVKLAEARAK